LAVKWKGIKDERELVGVLMKFAMNFNWISGIRRRRSRSASRRQIQKVPTFSTELTTFTRLPAGESSSNSCIKEALAPSLCMDLHLTLLSQLKIIISIIKTKRTFCNQFSKKNVKRLYKLQK